MRTPKQTAHLTQRLRFPQSCPLPQRRALRLQAALTFLRRVRPASVTRSERRLKRAARKFFRARYKEAYRPPTIRKRRFPTFWIWGRCYRTSAAARFLAALWAAQGDRNLRTPKRRCPESMRIWMLRREMRMLLRRLSGSASLLAAIIRIAIQTEKVR